MNLKKKSIRDLFLSRWSNKDFSKISLSFLTKILTGFGVLFLIIILFVCFEIYVPQNPISHETITYTVPQGWGDVEISKDLENLGIIRSAYFFRFYAVLSFRHSELKAGKYILSSRMSTYQITKKIAKGDVIKEKILIYEGWDIEDIGEYLESKEVCFKNDFIISANKDYSDEFDFLNPPADGKPEDISLEGFLFPDTYRFYKNISAKEAAKKFLNNFEEKFSSNFITQMKKQGLNFQEVVVLASLVESEISHDADRAKVAGILLKRLAKDMPLQIDATIIYIKCEIKKLDNCRQITNGDLKIKSAYNTYLNYGLPAGPISNPGIGALKAVLYPETSSYLFYLSDPKTGNTIFSRTLEEHNLNKQIYLN